MGPYEVKIIGGWGVQSDREISLAPVCVILWLGLWSWISGPGLARALGVGA